MLLIYTVCVNWLRLCPDTIGTQIGRIGTQISQRSPIDSRSMSLLTPGSAVFDDMAFESSVLKAKGGDPRSFRMSRILVFLQARINRGLCLT